MSQYDTTTRALFPELDGILYLSGASSPETREANRYDLGVLATPACTMQSQLQHYTYFGADNGLYVESKAGRPFDDQAWLAFLDALPRQDCLFAALPDVLEWHTASDGKRFPVGNWEATVERSARYVTQVKELGFPVAIVAQDGFTSLSQLPFDVDAVFVGGSDAYKLGPEAAALCRAASDEGLWVHVGRVNSLKRLRYARDVMAADSADGTYVAYGPRENAPKVLEWLDTLNGPAAN